MIGARSRLLVALAAAGAGCLPRGNPLAGRQVIADRSVSLAAMVPPNGDGVLRLLITRPGATAGSQDLYVAALDPAGGPPVETLLVSDYDYTDGLGCNYKVAPCTTILPRSLWAFTMSHTVVWADPVTGTHQELPQYPTQVSPSGQRILFFTLGSGTTPGSATLYDIDGTSTVLDDVAIPGFGADDNFYYATSKGDLFRIPPSGTAEQIATGLIRYSFTLPDPTQPIPTMVAPGPYAAFPTPEGMLLLLRRPTSDPNVSQLFVRDPATGLETALPFNPSVFPLVSSDGRWLVDTSEGSAGHFTFFDYRANDMEVVDAGIPLTAGLLRPGHTELWEASRTWNADATVETVTIWVLAPGSAPVMVPNVDVESPLFTPDGTYWFSTPDVDSTKTRVQVGLADDPNGPKVQLNPANTSVSPLWTLDDDRVVASVYDKDGDVQERTDTILLDPRTGASAVLGQRGWVAAVGQTRVMGIYHSDEQRGDLTVTEIDSGDQTVLAPEFTVTAFAEPQGTDQLAPDTRIAYQFQARTDSPYDGIWLATCP